MNSSPQYDPSFRQDDSWPSDGWPPTHPDGSLTHGPAPYGAVPRYDLSPWDPGFGGQSHVPSTAPAYAAAALFGTCGLLSFVFAVASWSGTGNPHYTAAAIGVVFSDSLTGNIDFAISATMTIACSTLTLAALLTTRLGFVRWLLVAIGAIVSIQYGVALLYLLAHDAGRYTGFVVLALFVWTAATVVGALPATARAMRGGGPPVPHRPFPYG